MSLESSDSNNERRLRQYVEQVGIVMEESGLPRMAGRILGYLLVCTPPHQSARELQEALEASKASISTMLKLLTQSRVVERIGVPGERAAYYRIRRSSWIDLLRGKIKTVTAMRQLAEEGLELLEDAPAGHRRRLTELFRLYSFWEQELPGILERYEQRRDDEEER